MASQPSRPLAAQSSTSTAPRHHPYSAPVSRPKWRTQPQSSGPAPASSSPSDLPPSPQYSHSHPQAYAVPPSPPRSRRDASETPSLGLNVAFGGQTGGKWWDEELPAPPASLGNILDSFKRSGEGDRDLLLAILGAKKAEEERLTALIQTRLTILQARLSLHSAAAALAASNPSSVGSAGSLPPLPSPSPNTVFQPQLPTPGSLAAAAGAPAAARAGPTLAPLSMARDERTPSLSSRASSSGDSSPRDEFVSPPLGGPTSQPHVVADHSPRSMGTGPLPAFEPKLPLSLPQHPPLPLPQQHPAWRDAAARSERTQLPPIRERETKAVLQQAALRGSPDRREKNGLEMLLDAGMQRETEAQAA